MQYVIFVIILLIAWSQVVTYNLKDSEELERENSKRKQKLE